LLQGCPEQAKLLTEILDAFAYPPRGCNKSTFLPISLKQNSKQSLSGAPHGCLFYTERDVGPTKIHCAISSSSKDPDVHCSARWPRHATRPPPPNVAAHTIYAITSSSAMELTASTCVTPFVDLLRASTASAVLHMCHGSASPGSARTPCVDLRLAPRFRRLATRR
jgi:hypothetical protein